MISKHPEIAKSFFLDESIVAEFSAFRREIAGTITALAASRWSGDHRHSESLIKEYLERAARIGGLLIQDASLTQTAELVYVGLDFSELYTYMSSDSRFVVSVPIVDFCIQQSPYSLYLLPGAAFELSRFMQFVVSRNIDRYIDNLKDDVNPLHIFLRSFEADPSNQTTLSAYRHAIKYIRSLDGPPSFNVKKLKSALDAGKVRPSEIEVTPITDDNHFQASVVS